MNTKIDPGAGYRLLEIGETVKRGDEFFSTITRRWDISTAIGKHVHRNLSYRRKATTADKVGETIKRGDEVYHGSIPSLLSKCDCVGSQGLCYRRKLPDQRVPSEPGTGYRFLEPGEKIANGDEVFLNVWIPCRLSLGSSAVGFSFRRKLPEPSRVASRVASCEPGYRFLVAGEIIERTDEYVPMGKSAWAPVHIDSVGFDLIESNVGFFRRREHYRLLNEGEFLKAGDEYVAGDRSDSRNLKWAPISPQACRRPLLGCNVGFFRRKIAAPDTRELEAFPGELKKLREAVAKTSEVLK